MNQVSIGSDNGLSPIQHQAIIHTNAGLFLIGPLRTNFSEILIKIQTFWFEKMHLKMSSVKWQPFFPGQDELISLFGNILISIRSFELPSYLTSAATDIWGFDNSELEIVDQWSTGIPPPHRRGWQWAMGGLQLNIVQNHKAAILKAT